MKRFLLTAITISLFCSKMTAQDTPKQWTLEECIRYAIDNNVSLKQREQDEESRKIEMQASRTAWIPDLNTYFGQNMDFGRSTSREGVIVDRNSSSSSFGAQLSMPVFNGFRIANTMAMRKMNFKAATEALNRAKDDLSLNVTSYYMQTLYDKEMLYIAELQVNLTKEQVVKTEVLVDVGRVPMSQLYDIQAQLARDEVALTDAANNVSLGLLDLLQALDMEHLGTAFDIIQPEMKDAITENMRSIIPPDDIYANAVAFKPQIKEQEYLLESRKKSLKVTQAGYYPRLTFSAGYSNGYYRIEGVETVSFGNQIKQNERKTISATLQIPIFNRF